MQAFAGSFDEACVVHVKLRMSDIHRCSESKLELGVTINRLASAAPAHGRKGDSAVKRRQSRLQNFALAKGKCSHAPVAKSERDASFGPVAHMRRGEMSL